MFNLSIRIYLTANLIVAVALSFFMFMSLMEGDTGGFVLLAILFSFFFSLPALLLLWLCLWLISILKLSPLGAWIFLLTATALIAWIPALLLFFGEISEIILPFSLGSAFIALLIHTRKIHQQFQSFNNESENEFLPE